LGLTEFLAGIDGIQIMKLGSSQLAGDLRYSGQILVGDGGDVFDKQENSGSERK